MKVEKTSFISDTLSSLCPTHPPNIPNTHPINHSTPEPLTPYHIQPHSVFARLYINTLEIILFFLLETYLFSNEILSRKTFSHLQNIPQVQKGEMN